MDIIDDRMNADIVNLEIETLLNPCVHREESVYDLLPGFTHHDHVPLIPQDDYDYQNAVKKPLLHPRASSPCEQQQQNQPPIDGNTVHDDLGICYKIDSLEPHELPVIGTYVDTGITPGFKYRVRRLCNDKYLFNGRALTLQSVGIGYGKRIVFNGDTPGRFNENYFYSDSDANGFGFSIEAVQVGQVLTIQSDQRVIGSLTILGVLEQSQQDVKSSADDGAVTKHVTMSVSCHMALGMERGGLLSLHSERDVQVSGIAVLQRRKHEREAVLIRVDMVTLPHVGSCQILPWP